MLDSLQLNLRAHGSEVSTAETAEQGLKLAESTHFDVALTDLQLPDLDGIEVLKRLKAPAPDPDTPDIEVIMITGYGSIRNAIEATKAGAFFFLEKPVDIDQLVVLIEKALERRGQVEEI